MLKIKNKNRIKIAFIGISVIFIAILFKLFYEQVINHENILEKAENLWERDFNIAGTRGSILDINLTPLAYDVASTSLIVVPSLIEDATQSSKEIADIIGANEEDVYEQMTKQVSSQKILPEGKQLDSDEVRQIEALELAGVYLVQDSLRYYPNETFLSQVLGFCGVDNQGLAGIELQYDSYLTAKEGSIHIGFDAKGNPLEDYNDTLVDSGEGNDIVLTIDANIQSIIEREMDVLMERYEPDQALALAMDPNTGEILAMVSKPDFDPNNYQDYSSELINRNLPIWMSFEPGSTFKTITFASALEEGLFDMFTDTYLDVGYEVVEGATIKSWKLGGHGLQTYLEVLQNSSNPGFVSIQQMLGLDLQYEYIMDFGFGSKTGIDLVGESSGIMFEKEAMGPIEQATVAFGQGLSVTPIQLVTAFCSLINGGTLYKPYIVDSMIHHDTQDVLIQFEPTEVRQVISEETSDLMRYALENVVALGGGSNAYIEGYQIGGKTGTAQKAENGVYLSNEYILSMIAAVPMDDPQIVLYIAVDSPNNDVQYGGTVVAPVIKSCFIDIIEYMGIEESETQIPKKVTYLDTPTYTLPSYIGIQVEDIQDSNVTFSYQGEGSIVVDQFPSEQTIIYEGSEVYLYLDD